MHSTTHT